MDKILFVALGGALGAAGRYLCGLIPVKSDFPVMTLVINFVGAFLIGIFVGIFDCTAVSENLKLFLKTGVCGGFTTFSTFSLETLSLFESRKTALGIIYIILSIGLCLVGVFCGKLLVTKLIFRV